VQALLDDLIERGLDPEICRLFIIDGSKALKKAVRNTFGRHTPIQRCQIHKSRNILDRLPKGFHATAKKALRQAWEMDDPDKGEKLLRNQPGATVGKRRTGRLWQHSGRDRRNTHRHPARLARRAAPLIGLHQYH
jgi:transposase-like protein